MRVDLTPEEIVVEYKDLTITFHKINSMTATELILAKREMSDKPLIMIKKLMTYVKSIKGLLDGDGNELGPEDLSRVPSSVIFGIYDKFLGQVAIIGNQVLEDLSGAEEKNSEKPASEDSGKELLSTPALSVESA